MDLEKLNALKQKGNEAFTGNRLEEAVTFYSEAINMAKTLENPMSKLLLSNRSQTYLKQQKYQLALEDADESLKIDPDFLKSIFRRAVANAELNNRQEAIHDLRRIFKTEPRNAAALSFMRRLLLPSKMDSSLHDAYIAQFLRRKVPQLSDLSAPGDYAHERFKCFLFRQAFLSVNASKLMQRFISGANILPIKADEAFFELPPWFKIRRLKHAPYDASSGFELSKNSLEILFQLTQPLDTTLSVAFNDLVKNFKELYSYSNVRMRNDWDLSSDPMSQNMVDLIRKNSQIITHLPYRPEVLEFNDTTFPKVNTLLVPLDLPVSMEFLKAWKKKQWGIKTVYFLDDVSDLRSFKDFKGIISNKVNRMYFALGGRHASFLFNPAGLGSLYREFNSLKHVFPTLSEVFGNFICHIPVKDFKVLILDGLKEYIEVFVKQFSTTPKPDWCSLKISIDYIAKLKKVGETITVDWPYLERVVNECRRGLKNKFHYIRLHRSSSFKFSLIEVNYFAMIEFKTDQAEVQVALYADCCE